MRRKQQFYADLEKEEKEESAHTIDEPMTLHPGADSVQANVAVGVKLGSAKEIGQAADDPVVWLPSPTAGKDLGDIIPEQKAADSVILSRKTLYYPLGETALIRLPALITCLHPDQPVTSIAAVKKNEEFPNKFRLKARMVDIVPRDPAKMIKRYCDVHRRQYVTRRSCYAKLMFAPGLRRTNRDALTVPI
jgi:hypothetical protein